MHARHILLGITGGIAAYKITFLIRLLKKSNAEVRCIMTPSARDFISPLVLSTLSGNKVYIDFWDKSTGEWANHVELGLWADVFLIAPATANTIAKMASGISDNLLLTTYFSMKGSTMVAPAMDLDMYKHPTVHRNLKQLEKDGVSVIPAVEGELASGLSGYGRMEEPEVLYRCIENRLKEDRVVLGLNKNKVLITAGPTQEKIDPVRFIGNHSSGKMGFELANTFLLKGYEVTLITGPSSLQLVHPNLELIRITSANEMLEEVKKHWKECVVGVFAAAVADYRPKEVMDQKIKKSEEQLSLHLVKNPDILLWASQNKVEHQITIGFALETNNSKENALLKLKSKNLDAIVLNSLENKGSGFKLDTNQITILDKNENVLEFPLKSKSAVAKDIVDFVEKII